MLDTAPAAPQLTSETSHHPEFVSAKTELCDGAIDSFVERRSCACAPLTCGIGVEREAHGEVLAGRCERAVCHRVLRVRFAISSFGLTLGVWTHRSSAFSGTS